MSEWVTAEQIYTAMEILETQNERQR
jgi:hypothetical protein